MSDCSGKPTARHERGLVAKSAARRDTPKILLNLNEISFLPTFFHNSIFFLTFAPQKPPKMDHTEKPKYKVKVNMKWLLLGLVFSAATVIMIIFMSQFFWIMLPFAFTFLALSIDAL